MTAHEGQSEARSTRKLAAILAADIAGYSALVGEDEEGTVRKLKLVRQKVLPIIEEFGGRVIDLAGDGILAEFPSAVRAVESAAAVQARMDELNAQSEPAMLFRIGVNVGDVIHEGEHLYGDGINIAARLQAIAEPGGICISNKVHEEVRDRVKIAFIDMGEQELKNIARPVRAFSADLIEGTMHPGFIERSSPSLPARRTRVLKERVSYRAKLIGGLLVSIASMGAVIGGLTGYWNAWKAVTTELSQERSRPTPQRSTSTPALITDQGRDPALQAATRLSLMVLPFTSINAEPKELLLADAISSDLTTELSRITGSFVISRATAFTYKGKVVNPVQIGRDLKVRYLLEGVVNRTDHAIRVDAELVETDTSAVIWSDRFESDRADLASLRNDFVTRVARSLGLELIRADARIISRKGSSDSPAVDQIALGWSDYYQIRSPQSLRSARLHFEAAIAADPSSLDAQTGLATVLANQVGLGFSDSPETDIERANSLIQDALSRDPDNAVAYFARGWLMRAIAQQDAALIAFQAALALNRNFSEALRLSADTLLWAGHPQVAIEKTAQFLELSPRDPNKGVALFVIGTSKVLLRDYEQAVSALREAQSLNDRAWYMHLNLAVALALSGHLEEGKRAFDRAKQLWPNLKSLRQYYADVPVLQDPRYRALAAETVDKALLLLGLPSE